MNIYLRKGILTRCFPIVFISICLSCAGQNEIDTNQPLPETPPLSTVYSESSSRSYEATLIARFVSTSVVRRNDHQEQIRKTNDLSSAIGGRTYTFETQDVLCTNSSLGPEKALQQFQKIVFFVEDKSKFYQSFDTKNIYLIQLSAIKDQNDLKRIYELDPKTTYYSPYFATKPGEWQHFIRSTNNLDQAKLKDLCDEQVAIQQEENLLLDLAEKSNLIVTGTVEESLYVIDEKKFYGEKSANNIAQLPNLKEGVKGILIRFQIVDTLFKLKDVKAEKSIEIYVKGGHSPPMHSDVPMFAKGKQYLVFLSEPVPSEDFDDAKVIFPLELAKGTFEFNHKSSFKVTENNRGLFRLEKEIVESVKESLKKH